ncbi:MAG: ABC transporter permease [Ferruginibacter sp.]|nr:ABC transporter permease [Cytophagales bacterium]
MNLTENIKEGLRAIRANMLRTVLTALIIAIGIVSLVGTLTAVEGIRTSVESNFASLGAQSFDIRGTRQWGRRNGGQNEKIYPPVEYRQATRYKQALTYPSTITITTIVTGNAEAKYASNKTNPNVRVVGGDENYLSIKALNLQQGRNFSSVELQNAVNVAIIGAELVEVLFPNQAPLNEMISVLGEKYKIIGLLEKKGSGIGGGGTDRTLLVPLEVARRLAGTRTLTYDITTAVSTAPDLPIALGEATGIMRQIRQDRLGQPDSFEITKSDSLTQELDNITGYLRTGGFLVGFITLLGAAIGLMNIMLVSVTERTREIGVRKALGATPARIRQQFLIEALVVCQLGGITGVVLGIVVGNLLSSVISDRGGFVVPWLWMGLGLTVCVVVGLLSGYYPAWKASKLDPIESLRFE